MTFNKVFILPCSESLSARQRGSFVLINQMKQNGEDVALKMKEKCSSVNCRGFIKEQCRSIFMGETKMHNNIREDCLTVRCFFYCVSKIKGWKVC